MIYPTDTLKDFCYRCSGRTDKNVSASGNVITIKIRLKQKDEKFLLKRLNSRLPNDITIWAYSKVAERFHPRKTCF